MTEWVYFGRFFPAFYNTKESHINLCQITMLLKLKEIGRYHANLSKSTIVAWVGSWEGGFSKFEIQFSVSSRSYQERKRYCLLPFSNLCILLVRKPSLKIVTGIFI